MFRCLKLSNFLACRPFPMSKTMCSMFFPYFLRTTPPCSTLFHYFPLSSTIFHYFPLFSHYVPTIFPLVSTIFQLFFHYFPRWSPFFLPISPPKKMAPPAALAPHRRHSPRWPAFANPGFCCFHPKRWSKMMDLKHEKWGTHDGFNGDTPKWWEYLWEYLWEYMGMYEPNENWGNDDGLTKWKLGKQWWWLNRLWMGSGSMGRSWAVVVVVIARSFQIWSVPPYSMIHRLKKPGWALDLVITWGL